MFRIWRSVSIGTNKLGQMDSSIFEKLLRFMQNNRLDAATPLNPNELMRTNHICTRDMIIFVQNIRHFPKEQPFACRTYSWTDHSTSTTTAPTSSSHRRRRRLCANVCTSNAPPHVSPPRLQAIVPSTKSMGWAPTSHPIVVQLTFFAAQLINASNAISRGSQRCGWTPFRPPYGPGRVCDSRTTERQDRHHWQIRASRRWRRCSGFSCGAVARLRHTIALHQRRHRLGLGMNDKCNKLKNKMYW